MREETVTGLKGQGGKSVSSVSLEQFKSRLKHMVKDSRK